MKIARLKPVVTFIRQRTLMRLRVIADPIGRKEIFQYLNMIL